MSRHSDVDDIASDSDVSELDNHDIGASSNAVTQLGFAEDPEEPLTADSFPSKSGGRPVSRNSQKIFNTNVCNLLLNSMRNRLKVMAQP